jgi:hypothetical protein
VESKVAALALAAVTPSSLKVPATPRRRGHLITQTVNQLFRATGRRNYPYLPSRGSVCGKPSNVGWFEKNLKRNLFAS